MAKQAKKGGQKTANKIKTAAAIVAISTAVACEQVEQPVAEWAAPVRKYAGDVWELQNAIASGFLSDVQPTGNIRKDFGNFLFRQGGGLSDNLTDPACWLRDKNGWVKDAKGVQVINWNAFAPEAYSDGKRKHTSNDITWVLFSNPQVSNYVGYKPTSKLFYEMPAYVHEGIVNYHIELGNISESLPINLVAAYCIWGSGSYKTTVNAYLATNSDFKTVNDAIRIRGEYNVFYELLETRLRDLRARNQHTWSVNGRGWSNGLAQFHRVFKVYCI